jgi:cytochrome c
MIGLSENAEGEEKMKKSLLVMAVWIFGGILWAGEGAALFQEKCSACHNLKIPKDMSTMVAPPAQGITMHVKMAYPDKEAFKKFVVDYVIHPSKEKSLCEKKTVQRFGIMPSQKGNVTGKELEEIAEYLYENFAKGGHLKQKHEMMKRKIYGEGKKHPPMEAGEPVPKQGKIRMH